MLTSLLLVSPKGEGNLNTFQGALTGPHLDLISAKYSQQARLDRKMSVRWSWTGLSVLSVQIPSSKKKWCWEVWTETDRSCFSGVEDWLWGWLFTQTPQNTHTDTYMWDE